MSLIAERLTERTMEGMVRLIETETFTVVEYNPNEHNFKRLVSNLKKDFGWEKSEIIEALKNIESV